MHVDLFVSCICSFLLDLPLSINYQDETIRIPAGQSGKNMSNMWEGAVNKGGGGGVKREGTMGNTAK